jgi:hypothetical protein
VSFEVRRVGCCGAYRCIVFGRTGGGVPYLFAKRRLKSSLQMRSEKVRSVFEAIASRSRGYPIPVWS